MENPFGLEGDFNFATVNEQVRVTLARSVVNQLRKSVLNRFSTLRFVLGGRVNGWRSAAYGIFIEVI